MCAVLAGRLLGNGFQPVLVPRGLPAEEQLSELIRQQALVVEQFRDEADL